MVRLSQWPFRATVWTVVTLALVACGGSSSGSTAGPAATPGAGATAQPGSATSFTALVACKEDPNPPASSNPAAGFALCEVDATDARVSGTRHVESSVFAEGQVAYNRAKITLANDRGTWTCTQFGPGMVELAFGTSDMFCTGSGAYDGLDAYFHQVTGDLTATWFENGWIVEGK